MLKVIITTDKGQIEIAEEPPEEPKKVEKKGEQHPDIPFFPDPQLSIEFGGKKILVDAVEFTRAIRPFIENVGYTDAF